MRRRSKLRRSQKTMYRGIMENKAVMLACDMGLGKTGATLTAIRDLLDRFMVTHVLVIAPLLVAEETWPEEIDAWVHTSVLDYEVLTGSPERRIQRAKRLPELTIVNTENVSWLVDFWGHDWPYDMVVIDESSKFKNSSKRNKPTKLAVQKAMDGAIKKAPPKATDDEIDKLVKRAVKALPSPLTRFGSLCKVRKLVERVVTLTGTLAPNGLLDIWSQFFLLDQGERLGTAYSRYRSTYFDSDYKGYNFTLRPGSFTRIVDLVQDITISMKTADYIDMPPLVYNTVPVHLPPAIMAAYKKFEKTLLLEEHDIEAVNEGVLTGKLLQLANGSVYDEDGEVIEIHDLKLDALDRIIAEANGAPILVAYSYKFDLIKLKRRYPKMEVIGEGKNVIKRWNEGKIQLLAAHPQSAGHGLNLQYGGCITVWYGLCWSLEYYQQLNKRLHRPGQTRTVFLHHIVAVGTVDERVMKVLPEKDALQDALIEATKYVDAA